MSELNQNKLNAIKRHLQEGGANTIEGVAGAAKVKPQFTAAKKYYKTAQENWPEFFETVRKVDDNASSKIEPTNEAAKVEEMEPEVDLSEDTPEEVAQPEQESKPEQTSEVLEAAEIVESQPVKESPKPKPTKTVSKEQNTACCKAEECDKEFIHLDSSNRPTKLSVKKVAGNKVFLEDAPVDEIVTVTIAGNPQQVNLTKLERAGDLNAVLYRELAKAQA